MTKTNNEKKDDLFIKIGIIGIGGVLASVIFIVTKQNIYYSLAVLFFYFLVMYLIVYKLFPLFQRFLSWIYLKSHRPKFQCWFELKEENDLRFFIYNPKGARETQISVFNESIYTQDGFYYPMAYQHDLILTGHSRVGGVSNLLKDTLKSNDKREIRLSWYENGVIQLMFMKEEFPVYGFRDGKYKYIVCCHGCYKHETFSLYYSTWIDIKDNKLVKIQEVF